MRPVQGNHENPPEDKIVRRAESSQPSLEWEEEGPGKEFSEADVRRGRSIGLRALLGLPEIKPL